MPTYRMGNGMVHLKFSGKAKKNPPKHCVAPHTTPRGRIRCNAMAGFLCDWPVEGGTCDAPLCEEHAVKTGVDSHFCPLHAAQRVEHEKGNAE